MTLTQERTPAASELLTGASALIALAHPDDEFLVGGLMEQLNIHDIPTHVVIATDGEASDRGDPIRLRNRYRRIEAGKALGRYGIRPENRHFLGLPDGELSAPKHKATIEATVGGLLVEHSIQTAVTLGHYGYDNHTDHTAVHEATEIVADSNTRLYGLTHSDTSLWVPADPALKLQRLAPHETQFDVDTSDPAYQPVPGTIEVPGIRLSEASRRYLAGYMPNMLFERYVQYPLQRAA